MSILKTFGLLILLHGCQIYTQTCICNTAMGHSPEEASKATQTDRVKEYTQKYSPLLAQNIFTMFPAVFEMMCLLADFTAKSLKPTMIGAFLVPWENLSHLRQRMLTFSCSYFVICHLIRTFNQKKLLQKNWWLKFFKFEIVFEFDPWFSWYRQ